MKTATIILNILLGLFLIPAAMAAITSPMMFDAPDSASNKALWLSAISAIALPLTIIICEIISWIIFFKGNYNLAFNISLIPVLINIALIGIGFYFAGK